MKRFFKTLFWLVFLGAAGVGVYYYFFYKPPQLAALSAIPEDAILIVETSEPVGSFRRVQETAIWRHLLTHPWFAETNRELNALDSLIQANRQLADLLDGRPIAMSLHLTGPADYDMLYLADLKSGSSVSVLEDILHPLLATFTDNVTSQTYHDVRILKVYDAGQRSTLHIAILGNLLTLSYSPKLMYAAIDQQRTPYFERLPGMTRLREKTARGGILTCYIHHSRVPLFLALFAPQQQGLITDVSALLDFTGMYLEVKDDQIHLNGYTYIHDSLPGYFVDILHSGNGRLAAPAVVPNRVALYTSLQFADYLSFYERMTARFSGNPEATEYLKMLESLEKWFRIDLKRDFVSWIGGEIALVHTVGPEGKPEPCVVIHTRSIDEARAGMQRMEKQIRRRSPVKFKTRNYKKYEINYLHIKGFFKLFLGKLLSGFEYPYYTYVDDCVVFALSEAALEQWIDDYEQRNTLERNPLFRQMRDRLDSKGNVFIYAEMKHLFPLMRQWLDADSWQLWVENEPWFRSFPSLGLWLGGAGQYFESKIVLSFDPWEDRAPADLREQQVSFTADTAFTVLYPSGTPQEKVVYRAGKLHGSYRSYYPNGNTREMGAYREGQRVGKWYFYNRKGKLQEEKQYEETAAVLARNPAADTSRIH
ncbi:MAG: DUF3352 domain-containing protein [Bacteroidetes bacterium]|nr:DUF3352 domain-containing protein [Bacteroidota bacterium]